VTLPLDHPQRVELNDEVHARPPEVMTPPLRLSYLAMLSSQDNRTVEFELVTDLARRFGAEPPASGSNHYSATLGEFRLRWERHTEFTRYQFTVAGAESSFEKPAIEWIPDEWLEALPGQLLVAVHAALVPGDPESVDPGEVSKKLFGGRSLVGSRIAGGAGTALTDFRVQADRFSRIVVYDHGMTERQTGRSVQRLLEIETYRVMALLALPIARELGPFFTKCRSDLSQITSELADADETDEPALLERLTRLEADLWSRDAESYERFSAADAYYTLVRRRIEGLRELRIRGLQTFEEFTERRLAPAMDTCRAVAKRQTMLYTRVGRATQLLATRVDMTLEHQNQSLLASMDRRANLQLRLQETVEGLSVAAITYYVVGLIAYAAKGLEAGGLAIDSMLVTGLSIPVVIGLVALGVRRIRRKMMRTE